VGQTYKVLRNTVFHVLRGPRTQDAGTPFLSAACTSMLDPGPGGKPGSAETVQAPQSLHRPWLLQSFYPTLQFNCGACDVPPDAGLHKKSIFPHTF
jgi:hypothetical protein